MRRCKNKCGSEIPPAAKCDDIIQKKGYCTVECLVEHTRTKRKAAQERKERKDLRQAKERVKPMRDWYDKLQTLVNQYVVHVRDAGQPCCTCGTTKQNIKYDAGHCFTRGSRSELRFELTNIHKQCSNYCNVNNSGFQEKHKAFIVEKYGQEHLAKLEDRTKWPSLKDRFPNYDAVKKEIAKYRKLLRDSGIKPKV